MKKSLPVVVPAFLILGAAFFVAAQRVDAPSADPSASSVTVVLEDAEFIGASRCRTCHRKEESGDQFGKWEASAHAKAWTDLATDAAKKVAAEKGIADPQKADECLKCHVTGHGAPAELLGAKYSAEEGVGCESCHGAGGNYYKKATMVSVTTGEIEGASVGLVKPTEETCVTCHNEESPTFKGFDYAEYSAKIAHPIPDEKKAEYAGG